jgi:ABC-type multidrug transport system permease subunit
MHAVHRALLAQWRRRIRWAVIAFAVMGTVFAVIALR